jgi:hypothetical protein
VATFVKNVEAKIPASRRYARALTRSCINTFVQILLRALFGNKYAN